MASNPRPVFKHPIPGREASPSSGADSGMIPAERISNATKDDAIQQVNWCGMRLAVRRMIGAEEFLNATDLILQRLWDGEMYRKELLDFELRTAIVVFYSNAELPQDTEERWAVLYGTTLYKTVRSMISEDQAQALEDGLKLYFKT